VGQNLLLRLKGQTNSEIISTYNTRLPEIHGDNINNVQIDLTKDCLDEVFNEVDIVFHFANKLSTFSILQKNPNGPILENTTLNMRVLEAAKQHKVKKFVWLSSMTGYPHFNKPAENEYFHGEPLGHYSCVGWMSRYFEKVLNMHACSDGIDILVLRPTSIYGPYDDFNLETCHALPALINKIINRHNPIKIWGNGEDYKDWVHVNDIVNFILSYIKNFAGYTVLNIGSGETVSLNYLAKMICDIEGFNEAKIERTTDNKIIKTTNISLEKYKDLSKGLKKTPLNEGITTTIKWYKESLK
jgi:GDP-L-fucose synthase